MIKVSHIYECDACGAKENVESIIFFNQIPNPCLPKGWVKINEDLYCNKHEITVDVLDGLIKYNQR